MKIKKITDQIRRDFSCIYECEHCGHEIEGAGYDDEYFHFVIIPNMECVKCGKKSPADYEPRTPKYPDGFQV